MDHSNADSSKVPQMQISPSGILLKNVDSFIIIDPETGDVIFDANSPVFSLEGNTIDTLSVDEIETNRIISPIDENLTIQSDSKLSLVRDILKLWKEIKKTFFQP